MLMLMLYGEYASRMDEGSDVFTFLFDTLSLNSTPEGILESSNRNVRNYHTINILWFLDHGTPQPAIHVEKHQLSPSECCQAHQASQNHQWLRVTWLRL